MAGKNTNLPAPSKIRCDYLFLSFVAALISLCSLLFFYHHNALMLYGDAVAHMNIARRVFDSRTPGFLELGTVWLPLPHIIDMPFVVKDWLWQTGLGAAIPSMIAYVAGTLGIFRLVRALASRTAAWIATLIYMLNPNLIYMQATAMTESLYLALFIWAVIYFSEFVQQVNTDPQRARRLLERCALMLAASMLVRYDGWFLAVAVILTALFVIWKQQPKDAAVWRGFISLVLLCGATAGLWLAYNHGAFYDAMAFATGPYSARAIAKRMVGMPTYPGQNDPRTATLYVLKVIRLNPGEATPEYLLFTVATVALLALIYFARRYSPWLLLWIPLPFYILSVAWGGAPVYFPQWWPYSYYNVRYGLELLPAVAVFVALGYQFLQNLFPRRMSAAVIALLVIISYVSAWGHSPICLREAQVNGRARSALTERLAMELSHLPPNSTLMMSAGWFPGALQQAGIHFVRVLRESNHPEWDIALSHPAVAADYIIAFEGADVYRAVRLFPKGLQLVAIIETPTQPKAFIYHSVR